MNLPRISVVIVNWNGLRFLDGCLSSLFNQSYHRFEIIMVDNGSIDGSVQFIRNKYPRVMILENQSNTGFAAANNQGIKAAKGKYVALLNNDTMADKDWLGNLAKKADSSAKDVGMWACKILSLHDPAIIDSVGGLVVSMCGIGKGRGRNERDANQYDREVEVFIPSACAAMYKKEMLDEIGLFDEEFFAYCEDTDLGLRARLAGWKTISVPDAIVYHYYSGTTGRYTPMKAFLVERNHIWVVVKNFPFSMLVAFPLYTIWRYLLHVYALVSKKGAGARYVEGFSRTSIITVLLKAYWGALKGMPAMLRKRHSIQASRVVSKKEIGKWFKGCGIKISEFVFQE